VVGLAWLNEPESYAGGSIMLPAGPPMPDRSRAMTQTKRDTLVPQVGGWAQGLQPCPVKTKTLRRTR